MPEVVDEFAEEKGRQNSVYEELQFRAASVAVEEGIRLRFKTVAVHAAQRMCSFGG